MTRFTRRLATVLCVALASMGALLSSGAISPASAARISLDAFMTKYAGKHVDVDGAWGAQCTDLYRAYNDQVLGGASELIPGDGGAKNLWTNETAAMKLTYTRIAKSQPAKKGDVVVWDGGNGFPSGHVAIVYADAPASASSLKVFSQNHQLPADGGAASRAEKVTLSKSIDGGVLGYLRPKKSISSLSQPAMDFNGDARSDVFHADGSSTFSVSYGGSGSWHKLRNSTANADNLKTGDFNGDGKSDIFHANGREFDVSYGGSSSWHKLRNSTADADNLIVGDFNGDGKSDIFHAAGGTFTVSYGGSGSWHRLRNSSATACHLLSSTPSGSPQQCFD